MAAARLSGWQSASEPLTPAGAVLVWLGYIIVVLAAFNMIPGYPLVGGRVLRAIIWWITRNADRATKRAAQVGQIVASLFKKDREAQHFFTTSLVNESTTRGLLSGTLQMPTPNRLVPISASEYCGSVW